MALTGKNEIVGTLYYMSPEQLQSQATGLEIARMKAFWAARKKAATTSTAKKKAKAA
jgi:serine/threonine protein kinase